MAQGFGEGGMTLMGVSGGQAEARQPASQWLQAPGVAGRPAGLGHQRQAR